MPPAQNTTKGVGRPPKPPLWPDPWTHPHPTPYEEAVCTPPSASEQGNLLLVFAPPCCSKGPNKALPEFFFLIYFWLRWVFAAGRGLSLVAASGGYSSLRCVGFPLRWLLLWSTGSRHAGLRSCGAWAQQLWLVGSRAQAQ